MEWPPEQSRQTQQNMTVTVTSSQKVITTNTQQQQQNNPGTVTVIKMNKQGQQEVVQQKQQVNGGQGQGQVEGQNMKRFAEESIFSNDKHVERPSAGFGKGDFLFFFLRIKN